jgi:curli biogenesis system outer membrane secretion channel CsgG
MTRVMRLLMLTSAAALAACASQPRQQLPAAATAAAPVSETPSAPQHVLAQANFALQAEQAGFSPESRDGAMLYCRHAPSLGSRIPHIRCFTPHQVRVILQMR